MFFLKKLFKTKPKFADSGVDVPISFIPSPKKGFRWRITKFGEKCSFSDEEDIVLFLDFPLTESVFRWTILVEYDGPSTTLLSIVVGDSDDVEKYYGRKKGRPGGICSFEFGKKFLYGVVSGFGELALGSSFGGMREDLRDLNILWKQTPIPSGSYLSVEADADRHVVSFFVGEEKLQDMLTEIPTPFYLGIGGHLASFTHICFSQLSAPTPVLVPLACIPHVSLRTLRTKEHPHLRATAIPPMVGAIPHEFMPNPMSRHTLTHTPLSKGGLPHCVFGKGQPGKGESVFIDKKIEEGVFSWTLKIKFDDSDDKNCFLDVVAASPSYLDTLYTSRLTGGEEVVESFAMCGFRCGKRNGVHGTEAISVLKDFRAEMETRETEEVEDMEEAKVEIVPWVELWEKMPVDESTLVTLEADTTACTLSFLVNGVRYPYVLCDVRPPLFFGVVGYGVSKPSFTSVTFARMAVAADGSKPTHTHASMPSSVSTSSLSAPSAAATTTAACKRLSAGIVMDE